MCGSNDDHVYPNIKKKYILPLVLVIYINQLMQIAKLFLRRLRSHHITHGQKYIQNTKVIVFSKKSTDFCEQFHEGTISHLYPSVSVCILY